MSLILYYAPMTCALVPYVTLTEAGAEFDVRNVNTRAGGTRTPDFLAVNPKHKVPVLLIDGEPLTENVAIQLWIARRFPKAGLLPAGDDEIRAISLMAWFASTVHPHLTPNARPENYCDLPGSEESVKRVGNRQLFADLEIADGRLRVGNGSSTISPRSMRTSSGVSGARSRSSSTCRRSRPARRISSA